MIGKRQELEPKLFYMNVEPLEKRIPKGYILRRINETIDFGFVREAVAPFYGIRGHESIDPIVLMKLMLLLFLFDVKSERVLMEHLAFRFDWLWFCRLDLDDTIPNHSVLSKARRLWGPDVFAELFGRILQQCIDAGLVDGSTVHVDASCIDGDVDRERLQPVLRKVGTDLYDQLDRDDQAPAPPSGRLTGQSDPDAGVTKSYGQTVCGYKDHRVVDDAHGVITATVTTDAACNEKTVLDDVLDEHEAATGRQAETVVADKQYGTASNYAHLRDKGITPCIPHPVQTSPKGMFSHARFVYDAESDCFVCPAGQPMRPYRRDRKRRRIRYRAAKGVCLQCPLKAQCTSSKHGRAVQRHMDQDVIDWADGSLTRARRRHLMGRRKACVEGSFGDAATHHGFKRSRWRGRWRMRIQNLLIAACQNLRKLLKATRRRRRLAASKASPAINQSLLRALDQLVELIQRLAARSGLKTESSMAPRRPSLLVL